MLKKFLFNQIESLGTPERRLNVLMPVMVVIFLAGVILIMYRTDNRKNDTELLELKAENTQLRYERDSIIFKDYNDKMEIYKKLEYYITTQNSNKKVLRHEK